MDFLIDFNRNGDDEVLIKLGAHKVSQNGEFIGYFISIYTLEDLESIEKKVKEVSGIYYSLIVSVSKTDGNTIYLDKDI